MSDGLAVVLAGVGFFACVFAMRWLDKRKRKEG